ncbi:MAG: Crp/Fnr family transcriptional regulator [Gemmatimonadales bacterium]|nr:MAG: Crp/Fnr family transcriptional regulator [Gemmatimonadales bacterium]
MAAEMLGILGGLRLFRDLGPDALEQIAARCVVRKVPARRQLFRMGDPCEGLWVVVRGRVRVYRASRSGREQVLHDQGPGQPLAEVPLFDGGSCPAHARAEEDSELLFLPRADFELLYRSEPAIADAVIRDLGRRLRGAVRLIEKISLRDVPSRVGLTLLEFASAATGPPGPDGAARVGAAGVDRSRPFELSLTQTELAESLAATRESVARGLRTLREEGLIEQEGTRVRIPDPEALEARCWGM